MTQNLIRLFLKKKQFLPHTPLTVFLSILLELVLVKNLKWLLQKQKVKPQQFQLPDHFWKFQQGVLHFIWMLGKMADALYSILSWNINQGTVNFYCNIFLTIYFEIKVKDQYKHQSIGPVLKLVLDFDFKINS